MQIAQGDEMPIVVEGSAIRDTSTGRQTILAGGDGTPGHFLYRIFYQKGEYNTPRHRHPFDQWRYQLEGDCGYDHENRMKPGMLGYFPEGAYYGPNSHELEAADAPNVVCVMQFGGPSGNGFPSVDQLYGTFEKLKAYGRFEKGVFYRNEGVPGKKTMDSFQASWEFLNGRPLVYPTPQYDASIMMETHNYRWMPLAGAPGVAVRAFGTFTDCAIRAASFRLDPGASLAVHDRGVYLVLAGRGTLENTPYKRLSALHLETGERATFTASETTEVLLMGLPDVARIRTPLPHGIDAVDNEELSEA
jgi:hypothetical protein